MTPQEYTAREAAKVANRDPHWFPEVMTNSVASGEPGNTAEKLFRPLFLVHANVGHRVNREGPRGTPPRLHHGIADKRSGRLTRHARRGFVEPFLPVMIAAALSDNPDEAKAGRKMVDQIVGRHVHPRHKRAA